MSNKDQRARFKEMMAEAGFKSIPQLAKAIVLNIPEGASFPLSGEHLEKCIGAIRSVLAGDRKVVSAKGDFSTLVLELATILNTTPEYLFGESIPDLEGDYNNVSHITVDTPTTVGHDQDKTFVIRDILNIQHIFKDDEWDVMNCIYVDGLTLAETAAQMKLTEAQTRTTLATIDRKLKHLSGNGLLADYTADPSEYFFGADWRSIEEDQRASMAGEFRRTAYRASFQPDNISVQREVLRAQKTFMTHALKNDGSMYLQVSSPAELVDVIHGVSYAKNFPDPYLMQALRNSFAKMRDIFRGDELLDAKAAITHIQKRLTANTSQSDIQAYDMGARRQESDVAIVRLALDDVTAAANRPPFSSFGLR